jgi:hypothetical protein
MGLDRCVIRFLLTVKVKAARGSKNVRRTVPGRECWTTPMTASKSLSLVI